MRAQLETLMEALAAATKTNAEIIGLTEVGVIAADKQVELVLWNGNPTERVVKDFR